MISLQNLGQPPQDDPFKQFGGSIEDPQTTYQGGGGQGNYPPPPPGQIWAIQPDGTMKLQAAPGAPGQTDPNLSFDANGKAITSTPWASVAPGSGASGFTPTPTGAGATPQFTAGMTPEQVRAAVTQFYASKGVTPNPTSVDYWVGKWNEFGQKDPAYFSQRLGQADEFGGGQAGFGSLTAPINMQYQLPSGADLENTPGYQFIRDQALKSVNTNAAAKGLLNTAGTAAELEKVGAGAAASNYFSLANLGLNAFNTNYGIARNNQSDPWNKLYQLSSLGFQGATA